jgi:hypothetical protein
MLVSMTNRPHTPGTEPQCLGNTCIYMGALLWIVQQHALTYGPMKYRMVLTTIIQDTQIKQNGTILATTGKW